MRCYGCARTAARGCGRPSVDLPTQVGGTTRSRFSYTLDWLGLRTGVSETLAGTSWAITYGYDGLLRLTSATEAPGAAYGYTYDGAGNLTWQRDALGRWTHTQYDALNRPITVTVNYENGNPLTVDAANSAWATLPDTDHVQVTRYLPDGNVATIIDGYVDGVYNAAESDRDRMTRITYDGLSRQKKVLANYIDGDPSTGSTDTDRSSETAYDLASRVVGTRDALNRWVGQLYDPLSRVATTFQNCFDLAPTSMGVCDPRTNAATMPVDAHTSYDAVGRVVQTEDALGRSVATTYTPLGWVAATTQNPTGLPTPPPDRDVTTAATYDARGRVITTTDPVGATSAYAYDALGRQVQVSDPLQRIQQAGFDGTGTQRWAKTPAGRFTVFNLDGLGRTIETITNYADGNPAGDPGDVDLSTRTVYDVAGRRIATVDAQGRETRFGYDLRDLLTSVTENATTGTCSIAPCNVLTRYSYDRAGRRLSIVDARGITTQRFAYDAADQLVSQTDALNQTTGWTYDRGGRMVEQVDPRGAIHNLVYLYNDRDQLLELSSPSLSIPITQSYDAVGQRISQSRVGSNLSFAYDALGRTATITTPLGVVAYGYTPRGERARLAYPDGTAIDYTYWADGQLKTVAQGATTRAASSYDPAGRLAQVARGNSATTTYSYDGADRLTDLHTQVGGATRSRFTYTLDRLGLRVGVNETLASTSRAMTYSYDGLLRLTGATESPGTAYGYAYDLAGNRTSATVNGSVVKSRSYTDANQVVGWSYDAAGNLLSDSTTTYTYDALGATASRTVGGQTTSYSYTGDGMLVRATIGTTTTNYLQDLAAPLAQVGMCQVPLNSDLSELWCVAAHHDRHLRRRLADGDPGVKGPLRG